MVTAISGPRGGREGAGEAVASGTGQRMSRPAGGQAPGTSATCATCPHVRPGLQITVPGQREAGRPHPPRTGPSFACPTTCRSLPFLEGYQGCLTPSWRSRGREEMGAGGQERAAACPQRRPALGLHWPVQWHGLRKWLRVPGPAHSSTPV